MELVKCHGLPLLQFFLKTAFRVGKICKIGAHILRGSGLGIGQLFKEMSTVIA